MRPSNLVVGIALFCGLVAAPEIEAKTRNVSHPQKKSTSSRSTVKHRSKTASKSYTARAKYAKGKKGKRYASSRSKRPVGPPRQQTPTSERYAEIQQALAKQGYFTGTPNGEWGPDSVDAMKRFQTDHKLMADGKIGAKSLIELGLGPHQDAALGAVAKPNEQTPQGQQ